MAEEEISNSRGYFWPYYNLATAYLILGNREACIKTIKKFLNLNPNPSLIEEQLRQYKAMKGAKMISQNLLTESMKIIEEFLSQINSNNFQ